MTIRFKFEQVCMAGFIGFALGLVIGTHLYTLVTG